MTNYVDRPVLRILAWAVGIIALAFWAQVIIGVAVFAVPDRYESPESIVFSLIAFAIGLSVPGAVILAWRNHERRTANPRAAAASNTAPIEEDWPPIANEAAPNQLLEPLTSREMEILRAVSDGKSNKEIARDFVISTGTVKTHTNNLFRKLGASNRTEAVALARRHGLL